MSGPLRGVRVVEAGGIGPVPFAGMWLGEAGADVVRFDRRGVQADGNGILGRGKRSVALNLGAAEDRELAMSLCDRADILIEGFRPGAMERLGLGPEALHARNPRLVYGRMTGWGQSGPMAAEAGHDINYLGLTGVLHATGAADRPPPPPLNLVADFGGGAMMLVSGVLAALTHARATGEGQVVDTAMTDGVLYLSTLMFGMRSMGLWTDRREANLLDGGAPFYRTYACADGRYVAVGAIEPRFHAALLAGLGLAGDLRVTAQYDRASWPEQAQVMADCFATRPRDHWCEHFAGKEACVSPVLDWSEAAGHPHHAAREAFAGEGGWPEPAPRFGATAGAAGAAPPQPDEGRAGVLAEWLGQG